MPWPCSRPQVQPPERAGSRATGKLRGLPRRPARRPGSGLPARGRTLTLGWATANKITMIAANQAHRDTGVARDEYVDVFGALAAKGVCCMAQPLSKLAGAYFSADSDGPAVLLNSCLDEVTIRHTAAHELGHHVLGHATRTDERIDPYAGLSDPCPRRRSSPRPSRPGSSCRCLRFRQRSGVRGSDVLPVPRTSTRLRAGSGLRSPGPRATWLTCGWRPPSKPANGFAPGGRRAAGYVLPFAVTASARRGASGCWGQEPIAPPSYRRWRHACLRGGGVA